MCFADAVVAAVVAKVCGSQSYVVACLPARSVCSDSLLAAKVAKSTVAWHVVPLALI